MTHDVFVSHSSHDKLWAEAVCTVLEGRRVRCWIASRDIAPGEEWGAAIIRAIDRARIMIIIFSSHANNSPHVQREVERAIRRNMIVLPVRIEDLHPEGALEYALGNMHWLDASTTPVEMSLRQVAQSVVRLLGDAVTAPGAASGGGGSYISTAPMPSTSAYLKSLKRVGGLFGFGKRGRYKETRHVSDTRVGEALEAPLPKEHRAALASMSKPSALRHLMRLAGKIVRSMIPPNRHKEQAAEPVACTVFAPPEIRPCNPFIVQVFAHTDPQAEDAARSAVLNDREAKQRACKSLDIRIEKGTSLMFHLDLPSLVIEDPIQKLTWWGLPNAVQFRVQTLAEHSPGDILGNVTVSLNSVPVGYINFKLTVVAAGQLARPEDRPLGVAAHRFRRAFISYASQDRAEVMKRVQMLKLARIGYFQDVLSLEPGDRWEKQLYRHIDKCDLFLLFWSTSAKESKWVMEEVRYALKRQGGDPAAFPQIRPVIIEGPPAPKPPDDLLSLHFNDRLIYFMVATPGGVASSSH